jgi:pyrroline-5-carboxylate reductase
LLVGAGRMGGALLKGWVKQGIGPLAAIEPAPGVELEQLSRRHSIELFHDIDQAIALPVSACVVALKPQILVREGRRLGPIAASGAPMLSIAAGTSIAALRKAWGRRACVIRAMPNTPGAIGRGITALYAPPAVSEGVRAHAQSLVAPLGATFWVRREGLIDAVTAVSGSGPAYVFLFVECLARAARAQGFQAEVAERLARSTISGAGALLDADPRPPEELRRDVTSPRGTTEAALGVLMKDDALGKLVGDAVSAASARALELRRQSEA